MYKNVPRLLNQNLVVFKALQMILMYRQRQELSNRIISLGVTVPRPD